MRIQLNGAWRELAAGSSGSMGSTGATAEALPASSPTLAAALRLCGYGEAIVATAVNGEFVPARARGEIHLRDGDRVEVLAPMQGG
ncbi:MAG TPA: sulfur carrier protein ThiS [Steroidobacteraceae bacterium]|nr:sulfur carrier protein ThiS [Steroidobacteraceae bacterium]